MAIYDELEKQLKPMNTTKDLAAIGIPLSTLGTWRQDGKGPRFMKIGNTIMYPKEAVIECFRANTFKATTDDGYPGARA